MSKVNPSSKKKKSQQKYDFLQDLIDHISKIATVNQKGVLVIKKSDMKKALEEVFTNVSKEVVKGNRIRFPVLGIFSMKEIPARKAGKQRNPFTGQIVDVPARPASRKPKWTFPKTLKEFFSDKKNWK
ncbi:MAG: HU family DNA-binding protein [Leptospiraceae bacterium]|nr:HU family DNA-binding protein [Leptospiraceae bacterium]MDW7975599.1 HU family DNA-binding protein [Leptospiraceae bacterium]